MGFRKQLARIAHVFEHVGEDANVVGFRIVQRKREIVNLAVDDLARAGKLFAGGLAGVRGKVDARDLQTPPGRLQKEVAVAAADFQHPRTGRHSVAFEQVEVLVGRALFEGVEMPVAKGGFLNEGIIFAVNLRKF